MIISGLENSIAAVCPVVGVGIGDPADRSTWRIDFDPDATDEQKAAAQAALLAFDPNAPIVKTVVSYPEFEGLFTAAESNAIMAAAAGGNAALLRWLLRAAGAVQIDLGNPETVAGVHALVATGLVTSARGALILAGAAPP